MESKQRSQQSQGINTGNKQDVDNRNSSSQVRKKEDEFIGFSAQEQPSPDPKTSPDMPPGPARREYDDTGHEHEHKDPTANPAHKKAAGLKLNM